MAAAAIFSRWRPPPSWILKFSFFVHVTVIGFNICFSVQNFIKIGWFLTEIYWFSDFQMGPSAILDFKNLQFLFCSPCQHAILLPHRKFCWYRTIDWWVMAKKAIFKTAATAILNFKNFNFWSRGCRRVQYIIQCTKFYHNRTIFHWDMAILRFSKWRPSAILDFKNLQFLSCSPCRHAVLLPYTKFRWNRTIDWWVMT